MTRSIARPLCDSWASCIKPAVGCHYFTSYGTLWAIERQCPALSLVHVGYLLHDGGSTIVSSTVYTRSLRIIPVAEQLENETSDCHDGEIDWHSVYVLLNTNCSLRGLLMQSLNHRLLSMVSVPLDTMETNISMYETRSVWIRDYIDRTAYIISGVNK